MALPKWPPGSPSSWPTGAISRVDADQLIELDADHVLAVATQRGTGTASGVETEARVHIVFKLAGDRIAGTYWFFEREKALRAAGLGPAA